MPRARNVLQLLCALVVAAGHAAAQPAPPSAPLTIDQAVSEGIDHNLSVVAERYNLAVADARIVTAGLRPNPVLTAGAMLPDATIFNNSVNPKEGLVRGDALIERGGKRERRLDVAHQARGVAELQLQNTVRALVLDVQSAFIDVQLATSNLALARESLSAFNEIVRINSERVRAGDLAPVELSRTRLAALQFQNDVRSREARLASATSRLRTLIGRSGGAVMEVAEEWRRDFEPPRFEALRLRALELRPDLKALERDQARSVADVRLQLAQGKIDYTVSGEFHRQISANALAGNEWGLFVSAPLPLFNRNQGEAERARQEARQAEARIRALQAGIVGELTGAWAQYLASRDLVNTIESQMLGQAREVRDTTGYSYRRGEASFIELLDAQRTFNETMQSYNDARAEYARSLYTLDALTGGVQR